jgi:cellulose synthase/poly-beta-1,6-N-acetylglucosamine synthase-like glycosyltransferase
MQPMVYIVEALLLIAVLVLLLNGTNCYFLLYRFIKFRKSRLAEDLAVIEAFWANPRKLPLISIQLPVYNERYVIERLIDSVCRLNYPARLLEIQVLDDSDDDTSILIARLVANWERQGFNIQHIKRNNREGFKAGALKEGLKKAKGKYIAVFDADFLPPEDFLRSALPFFSDKRLAVVQSRWGHVNANYSWLTMAQSIAIDGHFAIEQGGRCLGGYPSSFNGTAGLWRKQAILDAGNWQSDTLTEDIDLSYRVQLKGWRIKFLGMLVSPAELPGNINAVKSQQYRWAKGTIQAARKLIPRLIRSDLSWGQKYQALLHLTHYAIHPMLLLLAILSVVLLLLGWPDVNRALFGVLFFCLLISIGGSTAIYTYSQRLLYPDWKKRLPYVLALTILGTGIAVNNTKAFVSGLWGKNSDFIRTPKLNVINKQSTVFTFYRSTFNWMFIAELFMGIYCWCGFCLYLVRPGFLMGPFLLIYAMGFFYVGLLSIIHYIKETLSESQESTKVLEPGYASESPFQPE